MQPAYADTLNHKGTDTGTRMGEKRHVLVCMHMMSGKPLQTFANESAAEWIFIRSTLDLRVECAATCQGLELRVHFCLNAVVQMGYEEI